MGKLVSWLEKVQLFIASCFFILFVFCVALQVFSRYLGYSLIWTEELTNYAFIWSVFMGAAIMVRHREHFQMTFLIEKMKGKVKTTNQIFIDLLVAGFGLFMLVYGWKLTVQFWDWGFNSLPSIKQRYVWMAIPVSGFTIVVYSLYNMVENLRSKGGDVS